MRRAALLLVAAVAMPMLSGCFDSPPQVVSLNPNNGSTNVPGDLALTIVFDHPVVEASVMHRLSIDPPLPGCDPSTAPEGDSAPRDAPCRARWTGGGTELVLEHFGSPFAPETKYTVSLVSGFVDGAGVANSLDHRWELTAAAAPVLTGTTPADGAQAVSVDAPVVLTFSTYMAVPATSAAVTIAPPVPGTSVAANTRDHGRFVVLPGHLLSPNRDYTLTVGRGATDEHGLHLVARSVLHFRTGGLDPSEHALVLAGRPGEQPSQLILARLGAQQPGDPVAGAVVRSATRCDAPPCGPLDTGQALETYPEAVVSPDGSAIAVVVRDVASRPVTTALVVQSLTAATDRVIAADAAQVSWSPDSRRLAYQTADGVHITTLAGGASRLLPAGAPVTGPVGWSGDGNTLILPVLRAPGVPGVDLADAELDLRYALPSVLPSPVTDAVLDPGGDTLAVRRLGDPSVAGTWTLHLSGGDSTPRRLGGDLTPVDWLDNNTLLAIADGGGSPSLVRVDLAGGDRTAVATPTTPQIGSIAPAASGHQITYLGDAAGVTQAFVANADGTGEARLTTFAPGTLQAEGISLGG